MKEQELKELIIKYDKAYREGNSLVPDNVYDGLVEKLINLVGEDDEFFKSSIKSDEIPENRKDTVPITMASLNKIKSASEIHTWFRLKNIPVNSEIILTPKFDGNSISKEEAKGKGWTRGSKDSHVGLRCDEHLKFIKDVQIDVPYTFGEVIISRENYQKIKDSFDGDSPRNAVAGLFRRDEPSEELEMVDFIKYGVEGKSFDTKKDMLDFLNKYQKIKVNYKIHKISELTDEYLKEIYKEFSSVYEIDGLVLELNDISLWEDLGRERNDNPKWGVAYKGNFEEIGETICIDIENNISKDGNIIPVAIMEPVKLDGASCSRVTLNNYSFMKEMGIGIGSRLKVKRSGGVIPLIVEVLDKKEFVEPNIECYWEGVHLKTKNETDEQKIAKNLAFFRILGVEFVSDETIKLLYNSGYKDIKSILEMTESDFEKLDRFGKAKAKKSYNAIHSKLKDVQLCKLQHASGLFSGLGSKKLALVEHFETKPSYDDVMKIEGYSDISVKNYLDGWDGFWNFIKDLSITWVRSYKIKAVSNELEGKQFVFSGIRNKNIENIIISKNGIIGSSISKKTNYLIMKQKNSGSSKEIKAMELGVKILDMNDLEKMLS